MHMSHSVIDGLRMKNGCCQKTGVTKSHTCLNSKHFYDFQHCTEVYDFLISRQQEAGAQEMRVHSHT